MPLSKVQLLDFPKISDDRGNISFVEGKKHIPFDIKRVYYLYDVPTESQRGAHGHKTLEQVIIAISGSFEFTLDDGYNRQTFFLKKPWQGLYVPPMMWRELNSFSSGSVCFVLASDVYKEDDYYRDYKEFLDDVKR
ncbi:MAG: FdtA/QdtA family cupin domain-containing protein [Alphaproteobacteria bacterium]|nr:FdtA/QdtA family cupin domain-containing protein [Alphaproteobacteria bacterium]